MPEPRVVQGSARSEGLDRAVAAVLQPRAAAQLARQSNTRSSTAGGSWNAGRTYRLTGYKKPTQVTFSQRDLRDGNGRRHLFLYAMCSYVLNKTTHAVKHRLHKFR